MGDGVRPSARRERPVADAPGREPAVVRLVAGHGAAVVAEWASVIAVLVLVYDRRGAEATAVASIGLLVASLLAAPLSGGFVRRVGAQRARVAGLALQGLGCAAGAVAGSLDLGLAAVLVGPFVAQGAATVLRPSGALLMPAYARTSRELVVANLWIWYVEGSGVLLGPLLATVLLAAGGPPAALAGCAASCLAGAALAATDRERVPAHLGPVADDDTTPPSDLGVAAAWRDIRGRPGLSSVVSVVVAQYVLIGALDVTLVVIARDELGWGEAGPGLLSTAFGAGAVIAVVAGTRVIGRDRLAPTLGLALGVAAAACLVVGIDVVVVSALVALPILGACRSVLDGSSRMLLQRSVAPESLASVFVIRELCAGAGMIAGGVFALAALRLGGAGSVLVALGAVFALLLAAASRGLRVADASADVPVVEMSLLRHVPMFAPLPTVALEAVARAAATVPVDPGTVVITQGDPGDRFYVVADGTFDVRMSGEHIRDARRHDFFGEVALVADVPRTATVTARGRGTLLAIDRAAFLVALTGTDSSHRAAWQVVDGLELEPGMLPPTAGSPVEP